MNLLCGSNISEQNSESLYQFEEGQRAHTIKFYSNPINFNINSTNNIQNIKQKNDFQKKQVNQKINKEQLIKNLKPKESNKCSNNTSELEIIEYPINQIKNNDFENINEIILSKATDYINDKSQNDLLDYLKEKQGLNYLSLLLENDKYSYHSKNKNKEEQNDGENSSKSDEIICSYVEIDHNNSIISRMQKEKSAIKQSAKIFSQIHHARYTDYSLSINSYDIKNKNNKIKKTINDDKSKNKNEEKRIKIPKNMKKNRTDMKYKKISNHINFSNHSNNKIKSYIKKNKKKEKENGIKSFIDIRSNEYTKISDLLKSNKKKNNFEKKNNFDTYRSIEFLHDINPIKNIHKKVLNRLNSKGKHSPRKSHVINTINTERTKTNFPINKNINCINSKDKNYKNIYKNIKDKSIHTKSKKKINSKCKIIKNDNPLFNSINIKRNQNLSINKGNIFSPLKKRDSKKTKPGNTTKLNSKSKLKLRKLLINNMKKNKQKCDLSMYNINCLNNNSKIQIKKEKTLNKIMNKSGINKKINNSIHLKNNNNNDSKQKNNLKQVSISKIFKD